MIGAHGRLPPPVPPRTQRQASSGSAVVQPRRALGAPGVLPPRPAVAPRPAPRPVRQSPHHGTGSPPAIPARPTTHAGPINSPAKVSSPGGRRQLPPLDITVAKVKRSLADRADGGRLGGGIATPDLFWEVPKPEGGSDVVPLPIVELAARILRQEAGPATKVWAQGFAGWSRLEAVLNVPASAGGWRRLPPPAPQLDPGLLAEQLAVAVYRGSQRGLMPQSRTLQGFCAANVKLAGTFVKLHVYDVGSEGVTSTLNSLLPRSLVRSNSHSSIVLCHSSPRV